MKIHPPPRTSWDSHSAASGSRDVDGAGLLTGSGPSGAGLGADGGGASDRGAAGDGGSRSPVGAVGDCLSALGELNGWLQDVRDGGVQPGEGELADVISGLGHIDAIVAAARVRGMVAAEEAELAAADGQVSTAAWLATQLRMTQSACRREYQFAARVVDDVQIMGALERGQISRDHAVGLVQAGKTQQAEQDRLQAARGDLQRRQRKARERELAEAARQAADEAERQRLAEEARLQEERIAARELAAYQARMAADERARVDRAADLLGGALGGDSPDQLRDQANRLQAADADALRAAEAAQWDRRSERSWRDQSTGMGWIKVGLPGEEYDSYLAARQAATSTDHPDTPMVELRTSEQRRADGFIDLIGLTLRTGELGTSRGHKPHVTVTMKASTLVGATEDHATTQFGTRLSAETARRLACDASLSRAVLSATGQVMEMGRRTRRWSTAQYDAAALMFSGCAFPVAEGQACGRPIGWTDLHHVTYWRNGGQTNLDNGIPLCRRHHTITHQGLWQLTYDHNTLTVALTGITVSGRQVRRSVCFAPEDPHDRPPGDPRAAEQARRADQAGGAGQVGPRSAVVQDRLPC